MKYPCDWEVSGEEETRVGRKTKTCRFTRRPVSVFFVFFFCFGKARSWDEGEEYICLRLQRQTLLCLSIPSLLTVSHDKSAAFRSFQRDKNRTVSSALVLPQHFACLPPATRSLQQSYGWYSLCMHMLSCPILDLLIKIEGKKKEKKNIAS